MNLTKIVAIGAVAALAYVLFIRKAPAAAAGGTAVDAGDPRGTVAHAIAVVTKGAKAVAEEGKRAVLGQVKSDQRETDKKRRVGG
jgi:hypothetical protein